MLMIVVVSFRMFNCEYYDDEFDDYVRMVIMKIMVSGTLYIALGTRSLTYYVGK